MARYVLNRIGSSIAIRNVQTEEPGQRRIKLGSQQCHGGHHSVSSLHGETQWASLLNVDADRLHLILTSVELDIIVDALRSERNAELAERSTISCATQAMARGLSQAPEPDGTDQDTR